MGVVLLNWLVGDRSCTYTPAPGPPARMILAPATLPWIAPAADMLGGTGRSSAVSVATVKGVFVPDVGSTVPETTTFSRRSGLSRRLKLIDTIPSRPTSTLSRRPTP